MTVLRLIVLLCSVLAIICTSPTSTTNGTGTDAGEAKICGNISLPGGLDGREVTVNLRKQDYLPFSIKVKDQVKTVSGNDGGFILSVLDRGFYLVEFKNRDSLCAVKRFRVFAEDSVVQLGNIVLDTAVVFNGKILTDGVPASGGSLLVIGMDAESPVAQDGSFSVKLPAGDQLFRVVTGTGAIVHDVLYRKKGAVDTVSTTTAPSTVLDDFDDYDGYNKLSALLGGGGWFAFTDRVNGGNSSVLPTEEAGLIRAIDTSSGAWNGGSLHCTFTIDQNSSAPFALIGMDISSSKDANSGKSWFDLTNLTALTFMAKGSGTIYVQFTGKPIGTATDFTVYETVVTLSSVWTKYHIHVSDIPGSLSSAVPWSVGCTAVSNINFLSNSTNDLWLDELTVEGLEVTDFIK